MSSSVLDLVMRKRVKGEEAGPSIISSDAVLSPPGEVVPGRDPPEGANGLRQDVPPNGADQATLLNADEVAGEADKESGSRKGAKAKGKAKGQPRANAKSKAAVGSELGGVDPLAEGCDDVMPKGKAKATSKGKAKAKGKATGKAKSKAAAVTGDSDTEHHDPVDEHPAPSLASSSGAVVGAPPASSTATTTAPGSPKASLASSTGLGDFYRLTAEERSIILSAASSKDVPIKMQNKVYVAMNRFLQSKHVTQPIAATWAAAESKGHQGKFEFLQEWARDAVVARSA